MAYRPFCYFLRLELFDLFLRGLVTREGRELYMGIGLTIKVSVLDTPGIFLIFLKTILSNSSTDRMFSLKSISQKP